MSSVFCKIFRKYRSRAGSALPASKLTAPRQRQACKAALQLRNDRKGELLMRSMTLWQLLQNVSPFQCLF